MTIRNSGDDAYGVRRSNIPSYQAQGVVIDEDNAPMIHIDDEDFAEPIFRDVFWAVLFIVHLLVMIYLGIAYGSFGVDASVSGNSTSWKEEISIDVDHLESPRENSSPRIGVVSPRVFLRLPTWPARASAIVPPPRIGLGLQSQ